MTLKDIPRINLTPMARTTSNVTHSGTRVLDKRIQHRRVQHIQTHTLRLAYDL